MTVDIKSESLEIIKQLQSCSDPKRRQYLKNKFARLNLGLARKKAHAYKGRCTESYEEVEAIAMLGLAKALDDFDPSRGNAFSSMAMPRINGEILHHLRDRATVVRVPRRWIDKEPKIRRLLEQGWTRHAIAAEMGWALAELEEAITALQRLPCQNIDGNRTHVDDDDEYTTPELSAALSTPGTLISKVWIEEILMSAGYVLPEEGFFDATKICADVNARHPDRPPKKFYDFLRRPSIQKKIKFFENSDKSRKSRLLIKIEKGRNGRTLVDVRLAPDFLEWVDPVQFSPLINDAIVQNLYHYDEKSA